MVDKLIDDVVETAINKAFNKWGMKELRDKEDFVVKDFPPDFERMYLACDEKKGEEETWDCETNVRIAYRNWESERYYPVMHQLHSFLIYLDRDELQAIAKLFPSWIEKAHEFGVIEKLRKFEQDLPASYFKKHDMRKVSDVDYQVKEK